MEELRPTHPDPLKFWPGHDFIEPALAAEREGRTLYWWCGREVEPY